MSTSTHRMLFLLACLTALLYPRSGYATEGCYQDSYNLTYYCDTVEHAYSAILADTRDMSPWCPPASPPQYAVFKGATIFYKSFGCGYRPARDSGWGAAQSMWNTGCAAPSAWNEAAGKCLTPTDARPEKNAGPSCCAFGDPINPATGNKYEVKKEYQGNGLFPLEFYWTYNSLQRNPLVGANQFPQQFMLGVARQHNYSQAVTVANQSGVPAYAYVYRPEGNIETYTRVQAKWASEADNSATFMERRDSQGVQTGWIRRASDDRREEFNLTGRLVRIVDRSGLMQNLFYDSADRLQTVVDSRGRSIIFGYNASNQLATLGLPDGNQILFSYDSNVASAANLSSVTYPGGSVISYRYGEAVWAADVAQPHALTGVVDESGARYSSTYYNGSHQAVGTELADGVDRYSAAYTAATSSNYTESAVITGPLGQQEIGEYTATQGIARRTSWTSMCSGCVLQQSSSTFDVAGRSNVLTDFGGSTTDYDYDARGLLLQKTEAANESSGGSP